MELFNYLLKVSACSVFFFAIYLLVLRKLTFFKINRFYLLFSILLSFVIPALQITVEGKVVENAPTSQSITTQDIDLGGTPFATPIVVGQGNLDFENGLFDWYQFLSYLYGGIVAILLFLTAWRLYQLLKHTNKTPIKEINGLKVVRKQNGFTNCSFFNYVFIDENSLTPTELAVLLTHEEVHARAYHSVDKLLLMAAKSVLWFNPVIYLYDKALEQSHEYEADKTTSQNVGVDLYASLLLKLAVSRNSNPLIHNFVKSPIKKRIKMLFNSKSNNMKKLAYLLILPLGVALTWLFAVEVVYATVTPFQNVQVNQPDSLSEKNITGRVVEIGMRKKLKVFKLKASDKIYPISMWRITEKISVGDELIVTIGGNMLPPGSTGSQLTSEPLYIASRIFTTTGKKIFVYETEYHAFLYEANRARFASSIINSIEKSANGTINKIVLKDKGFTINLNVAAQKFRSDDFHKGDRVLVKFIGEKLIDTKTYTTDKLIALYSQPKKHELINKELYPRFYDESGKQKVYKVKGQSKKNQDKTEIPNPIKVSEMPALTSSSGLTVDNHTQIAYVEDARIEANGVVLFAKNMKIDNKNHLIVAYKATITKGGHMIVSDEIRMDTQTNLFTTKEATGLFDFLTLKKTTATTMNPNLRLVVKYYAQDSTKRIKEMVYLYGNAGIENEKLKVTGSTIAYNVKTNTAEIKDARIVVDKKTFTAPTMQVNFTTFAIDATGELKASWKD